MAQQLICRYDMLGIIISSTILKYGRSMINDKDVREKILSVERCKN